MLLSPYLVTAHKHKLLTFYGSHNLTPEEHRFSPQCVSNRLLWSFHGVGVCTRKWEFLTPYYLKVYFSEI